LPTADLKPNDTLFPMSLLAAMTGSRGSTGGDPSRDAVDVSAFASTSAPVGEQTLVQIFLHVPEQAETAAARAREADPSTGRRGFVTLNAEIARGSRVDIHLEGKDVSIDESVQSVIWRGDPCACQFIVELRTVGRHLLRVRVVLDGVPIGSLCFTLEATATSQSSDITIRGDRARRYTRAFLSYASPDRAEVLKRAQALRLAGLDFFQDVLSLEPGQRWERQLYREIDRCDLFLLFWSAHAASSEWVLREAQHALDRQGTSADDLPDITPVILEGPPIPSPPDALKHLHFNDYFRYFISGAEDRPAPRAS
jgi:hypothetical protein